MCLLPGFSIQIILSAHQGSLLQVNNLKNQAINSSVISNTCEILFRASYIGSDSLACLERINFILHPKKKKTSCLNQMKMFPTERWEESFFGIWCRMRKSRKISENQFWKRRNHYTTCCDEKCFYLFIKFIFFKLGAGS